MTGASQYRPIGIAFTVFAVVALACAGGADGERVGPGDVAPASAAAGRDAEAPSILRNRDEVEMHALSTSTHQPAAAAECGLPAVEAGDGALIYFGCTPERGPIVRAVPARRVPEPTPEAALAALLDGPTEAERARGYLSSFGPETAAIDWRLGERDSLAWVDFDRRILEVEGLFVVPMDAAQLVATLGQFDGTERVLILVGGEPLCKAQGEC